METPEEIADDIRIVVQKGLCFNLHKDKRVNAGLFTNSAVPYLSLSQSHIA